MQPTKELGNQGEHLAADYLKQKGYKILASNWRFRQKEIDIIVQQVRPPTLVFVEVKTRTYKGTELETADFGVNRQKQRFLIEAANAYIQKYDIDMEVRFDILGIVAFENEFKIEHIEDAFYPIAR